MSANSSHAHQIKGTYYQRASGGLDTYGYINANGPNSGNSVAASTQHTHTVPAHTTKSEGSSGTGANMPPYYAVFIWERTA